MSQYEPAQGILLSYVAEQPRETLDKTTAHFLNTPAARPVFMRFFESLPREEYNRLVRAFYDVTGAPAKEPEPEKAAFQENCMTALEDALYEFTAFNSLMQSNLVSRLHDLENDHMKTVGAGIISLNHLLSNRVWGNFENISKAGKAGAR